MSFQASDFLAGLFGAETAPAPAPAPSTPGAGTAAATATDGFPQSPDWDDCLEPDWSCETCGGIGWWESIDGGRHCLACERAGHERSQRLAERAGRLRKVRPVPRPRPEPPAPVKQSTPDPAKSGGRR